MKSVLPEELTEDMLVFIGPRFLLQSKNEQNLQFAVIHLVRKAVNCEACEGKDNNAGT